MKIQTLIINNERFSVGKYFTGTYVITSIDKSFDTTQMRETLGDSSSSYKISDIIYTIRSDNNILCTIRSCPGAKEIYV